jgi:hypothetical protein
MGRTSRLGLTQKTACGRRSEQRGASRRRSARGLLQPRSATASFLAKTSRASRNAASISAEAAGACSGGRPLVYATVCDAIGTDEYPESCVAVTTTNAISKPASVQWTAVARGSGKTSNPRRSAIGSIGAIFVGVPREPHPAGSGVSHNADRDARDRQTGVSGSEGRWPAPVYQAVLLDVYGTLVHEDDAVLEPICEHIAKRAQVRTPAVAELWWRLFRQADEESHGETFRLQADVSRETLAATLRHLGVAADADELCQARFDCWRRPPILRNPRRPIPPTRSANCCRRCRLDAQAKAVP